MELGVRRHLHDISQALYEQAGSKTAIVQDMMSDVDVLYLSVRAGAGRKEGAFDNGRATLCYS